LDPGNSNARVAYQPDATYLPVFADPQDTCLNHSEHVVLCHIARSLFVLHGQSLPYKFVPFPPKIDAIPDFTACTSDNDGKSLKATHARDQKTRAGNLTVNSALADFFLTNLPKAIWKMYEPI
jgi:hypothetical protein